MKVPEPEAAASVHGTAAGAAPPPQSTPLLQQTLRSKMKERLARGLRRGSPASPILAATPDNTHAFKMSLENLQEARAVAMVC